MTKNRTLLLGVTADVSLSLMRGLPAFLAHRGWDVHVVSSSGPHLSSLSATANISPHVVEMAREPRPFSDLRALVAWVRILRRVRPSVILVGTPKAGLLGMVAGFVTRVPRRIYMLRGLRLETESGIRRRVLSELERLTASASHEVLAVSKSLADRYVQLGLAPQRKTIVLGSGSSNGVDVVAHTQAAISKSVLDEARAHAALRADIPVVGFVGRLTIDKGVEVLAEATASLRESGTQFQLLVVGSLDEGQNPGLLKRLRESCAEVSIVGHVADTRPYFHLMDVLCLPTYREGFPNVVLEASAAGIPTVTTNATGAVDSVRDGETGLIVDVASAEQLATALRSLLLDQGLRERLGIAAHERVLREFDREKVWNNLDAFLLSRQ